MRVNDRSPGSLDQHETILAGDRAGLLEASKRPLESRFDIGADTPPPIDVVAAGMLRSHHLGDHICVSTSLADDVAVRCWETVDDDGVRLSDHPTVAIDLRSTHASE